MCESKELNDLILYYSIRLLDSGGQPQFHEVVSIVLPTVTGIVSVLKLSVRLDVHGEVGMGYRPMIPSPMSKLSVMISSLSSQNLVVVACKNYQILLLWVSLLISKMFVLKHPT